MTDCVDEEKLVSVRMREKHDGALEGRMDIRVLLRLLSCSMTIEKRLRRRFVDQFDTTLPRFDVLAALNRQQDGVTMSELSQALLVSNGNVTAVVRQLEADGLVISHASPEDRRRTIVMLTAEGSRYFSTLAQAHHGWIAAMFAGMSAHELDQLYGLLAAMKQSLGAEREERA